MKIAVVGAGSYVFGPSVLAQTFLDQGLDGIELALMDVDAEAVEGMAGVGRRMARERGLGAVQVTAHTERWPALEGADFVICCASPQMQRRHAMDREIIARFAPGHGISEFGGVAGISYSLRQIAFIEGLAKDMTRLCPKAWLLTVSNPLPRVVDAAQRCGVTTVGFCSVAQVAYGMLWKLLTGETIGYPFRKARDAFEAVTAGLNHHAFVVSLRDRRTGEDLLPAVRAAVASGATCGNPRAERMVRETGYLLTPTDEHTRDFFEPRPDDVPVTEEGTWHGNPEQRAERMAYLRAVAAGEASWDALLAKPSWERPLDLIAALRFGRPAMFEALNLTIGHTVLGRSEVPVVEAPAYANGAGLMPQDVAIPDAVMPYIQRTAMVTELIVAAALERSRDLLFEAADLDPTIVDKAAGRRALAACLQAHADLLPAYS